MRIFKGSGPPSQNSQINVSKGKRILVLNDQETVLLFLKDRLEHFGFSVFLAKNIQESLTLLNTQTMHGLLLDFEMAGQEGMAIMETMKQFSQDLPVIVMSADPTQTAMRKAIEAGAADYLTKPISPVILKYKCLRLFS